MAFTQVQSLDADVTYALGKVDKSTGKPYPKQAEGYYLGTREVEGKRGKSKIHFLQTPKGNVGLWGTTDLNRKISQVTLGTMVRVTSTGKKPTPKGDMFTYSVEQDKTNTIEVEVSASQPAEETYENEDDTDTDASGDASDSYDYNDTAYTEPVVNASAQRTEEQRRKVQELLNKTKSVKK